MTAPVSKIQPLVVRSITDQLYGVLREQILSGALEPGAPIRQDTLAAEFNISKIPLREALARLKQDRLVNTHPKRGFTVASLSIDEAKDVFSLRLRLEPSIAAEAALCANGEQRKTARTTLRELENAVRLNRVDRAICNRAFHYALLAPAAGDLTLHVVETTTIIAERYIRRHLHPLDHNHQPSSEHRDILTAWLDRDAEAVEELLEEHLENTLDELCIELSREAKNGHSPR